MSTIPLITAVSLRRLGACEDQVAIFAATFRRGLRPASTQAGRDRQARVLVAAKLNVKWAAMRLLTPAARVEFDRVLVAAQAEYDRVLVAAWAECDRVCAAALAENGRVRAALAEYDRVRAAEVLVAAWAECNRVWGAAPAACARAWAAAQAEYWRVCAAAQTEFDRVWAAEVLAAVRRQADQRQAAAIPGLANVPEPTPTRTP